MIRTLRKKQMILGATAIALAASVSVGSAYAYFTASSQATGQAAVHIGDQSRISEDPVVDSWTKHVVITAEDGSEPVFVRVKAFTGLDYTLTYSGTDWTPGETDDQGYQYYYYSKSLAAGESTSTLDIIISGVPEGIPTDENFNVVVVYETTPVQYDESGNMISASSADWSQTLYTGTTSGSGNGSGSGSYVSGTSTEGGAE